MACTFYFRSHSNIKQPNLPLALRDIDHTHVNIFDFIAFCHVVGNCGRLKVFLVYASILTRIELFEGMLHLMKHKSDFIVINAHYVQNRIL